MDSSIRGNPLSSLRFTRRMRYENISLFILPWLLIFGVDFFVIKAYEFTPQKETRYLMYTFAIRPAIILFIAGYLTQLATIRNFENLFRRIPYNDLKATLISGTDLYGWLVKKAQVSNALGLLTSMYITFLINLKQVNPGGLLALGMTPFIVYIILNSFVRTGCYYLLKDRGYFLPRLKGLGVIIIFILMLSSMYYIPYIGFSLSLLTMGTIIYIGKPGRCRKAFQDYWDN